jgi:hypothetical protein
VLLLAVILLAVVGMQAYGAYGYNVGTPATASVDSCTKNRGLDSCTGTWTIDGREIHGQIEGPEYSDMGSTVDARVHNGTAYTEGAVSYFWSGLQGLLGWTAIGLGIWFFRRRRRLK